MVQATTSAGTRIDLPPSVKLTIDRTSLASAVVGNQFADQEFALLDEFDLEPSESVSEMRSAGPEAITITATHRRSEVCVALIEIDGALEWVMPEDQAGGENDTSRFNVVYARELPETDGPGAFGVRRIAGWIWKKAKVRILRFIAQRAVGAVAKRMDGKGPFLCSPRLDAYGA